MTEEFNLSEKKLLYDDAFDYGYYPEKDVKEFIKRLKAQLIKLSVPFDNGIELIGKDLIIFEIDKLAGDKLK